MDPLAPGDPSTPGFPSSPFGPGEPLSPLNNTQLGNYMLIMCQVLYISISMQGFYSNTRGIDRA